LIDFVSVKQLLVSICASLLPVLSLPLGNCPLKIILPPILALQLLDVGDDPFGQLILCQHLFRANNAQFLADFREQQETVAYGLSNLEHYIQHHVVTTV
ncbi:hypothetical protein T4E_2610, partial [Trichinella pseudospiralis]